MPRSEADVLWDAYEAACEEADAAWQVYSTKETAKDLAYRAYRKAQRAQCICGGTARLADHPCPRCQP